MSGLLDVPKPIKPPTVAPIQPIPVVDEQAEGIIRRGQPRGRRETFLTGELIPKISKKRRLA